jgi:hypothetical protein
VVGVDGETNGSVGRFGLRGDERLVLRFWCDTVSGFCLGNSR